MKKYLLPENGSFYKANLHCHTVCSDGRRTPEEIKEMYKSHGYSVVAYTDHNVMLDHSDLADEDFLPLLSYEIDVTEPDFVTDRARKTCHLCFISLEPENLQVCWHRSGKHLYRGAVEHKDEVKFDENQPDYERYYSAAGVNDMIKKAREGGFFVTYNHPTWSQETYPEYTAYKGMNAMEIVNGSCLKMGFEDYNPRVYDDLLITGHRIYCVATDDNHNRHPDTSPHSDSFVGATMIKADKLEYRTITKALEDGNFYATMGPEINALWFEDGEVHIECSDAVSVTMNTAVRAALAAYPNDSGKLNSAVFKIKPEYGYVRFTVTDAVGKHACTNAYFTDELFCEN
ncbi:MAG: PHP domain-containing protein [Clostridia bacterium]|nr:PHP domain-containing protein [Clostridia bacterium]